MLNQNQIQLLSNLVNSNERQDAAVNPITDHTSFLVSNLLRGAQLPNNLDVFVVDSNSCNVYVVSP